MTFKTIFLAGMMAVAAAESCDTSTDDKRYTLGHDGLEREYYVHVPDNLPSDLKVPLIFVLHGGGGKAEKMSGMMFHRFNTLADRDQFIIVYPQGIEKSWNDGRNSEVIHAQNQGIDDVGFFKKLIDKMTADYPVDPERVFATGISNGGFMSIKLGCALPEKFRAIAAVTAQIPVSNRDICKASTPVSLMVINGTADPLVPYDGGHVSLFGGRSRGEILSTAETIKIWTKNLGCTGEAKEKIYPDRNPDDGTRVISYTYDTCNGDNQVVLLKVENGGHTWPGGMQYLGERLIGKTSRDINACDEIWAFFNSLSSGR